MTKKLLILSTGGTIEKSYCEEKGSMVQRSSQLKEHLLKDLRLPDTDVSVQEIMAKDSLEMTTEDRALIVDRIEKKQASGWGLVVLHGTDTLDLTLQHLTQVVTTYLSPIVFTGAMKPATLINSDARQNFIEALTLAQILPPGAYLAFHGQVFRGPWVKKNRTLGTFEATSPEAHFALRIEDSSKT